MFIARCCRAGAVIIVALALVFPSVVRGNAGTQLPLSQYQAGTETTALVPNGNFESVTGADANGWTETPNMATGSHVSGTNTNPAVFGSFAAQGFDTDLAQYTQTLTIDPATNYVLSAYVWNFGNAGPPPHNATDFDPGDMAVVELSAGGTTSNVILEPIASDGGNAQSGYFLYTDIPAGTFGANTSISLAVRNDLDSTGPWPGVVTQFDNVALTPASQFAPPSQVPEPAALSLLAAGGLALLRRRHRRP